MADLPAIEVQGLAKTYRHARLSPEDTSLRAQFTALALRPWRLIPGFRPHHPRDDIVALHPVSFTVARGERLALLGRNGSGKSTLLKLLARITVPSSGTATLRGQVAALLEVGTGFHPDLNGEENIHLNAALHGLSRRQVRERLADIVAFADIGDVLDLPVKRYSSGMWVRLAFAIAAHLDGDILLVDEVLAVGDEGFREKCLERMRHLADHGRTVVLVSHDMDLVKRFCERGLVLDQGRLTADGRIDTGIELYHRLCQSPEAR